jgi:hypothetical protein
MKNRNFTLLIIMAVLAGLFSNCTPMHQGALLSFDASTDHFHGYSNIKVEGSFYGANAGYIMVEDVLFGVNTGVHPGIGMNPGKTYNLAGGPSDDGHEYTPYIEPRSLQIPKNDFFTLSEEIELINKGDSEADGGSSAITKNSIYYLEVPVLLNYNHKLPNGNTLTGGLGIYAASALFGNYSGTYNGKTQSGSLSFGPNGDYDRMDYGLCIKGGYQFSKKFGAFINYDFGLKNLYGNAGDDKFFNRSLGINLAYMFK